MGITPVESAIRRKLLERDLIDTVIALGPNLFYGTGVPAAIIVARMKRPDGESGRVFFVDGSNLFNELRNQNELHRPHAEAILRLVSDRSVVEGTSRFVTHEEIKSNGWSLFPALYLWNSNALDYASKGKMKPPKALAASVRDAQAATEAVREAERRLSDLLGGDT